MESKGGNAKGDPPNRDATPGTRGGTPSTSNVLPDVNSQRPGNVPPDVNSQRPGSQGVSGPAQLAAEPAEALEEMLSHMNPKYVSPEASRLDYGAFSSFPDYSLHNKDCHDMFRQDTFKTQVPSHRKPFARKPVYAPSEKKWAPLEGVTMNDLLWICDQTFVKTAQSLSEQLNRSLEVQMVAAIDLLRREVTTPIEESCKSIISDVAALPDTIAPVMLNSATQAIGADLQKNHDMLRNLQALVSDSVQMIQDNIHISHSQLQKHVEHVECEVTEGLKQHVSDLKDEILEAKTAADTSILSLADSFKQFQEEARAQHETLREEYGTQLQLYVQESAVKVDFSDLTKSLDTSYESMKQDLQHVRSCVDDVQKNLKAELVGAMDVQTETLRDHFRDAGGAVSASRSAKPACFAASQSADCNSEETGAQTDPPQLSDAWIQTGTELMKKKKNNKSKMRAEKTLDFNGFTSSAGRKARQGPVFANEITMKQQVRDAMIRRPYNVMDYYHKTGCAQKIARHPHCETFVLFVVLANAFWISVDTDNNPAGLLVNAPPVFIVVENLFCFFFSGEMLIRFLAFEKKRDCLRDPWFVFDMLLTFLMIVETWLVSIVLLAMASMGSNEFALVDTSVLRIVKMVKLVRLSRMAKILRSVPELVIIVKAIGAAFRSIAVIALFCLMIVYVFAIIVRQITDGEDTGILQLQTVPQAMNALLIDSIFSDSSTLVTGLSVVNPVLWPIILVFVLLTSVTLLYMLIGVMVNVIQMVASTEREGMAVSFVANHFRAYLMEHGYRTDCVFAKEDFKELVVQPDVIGILSAIDVDVIFLVDVADQIFDDFFEREGRGINFSDFIEIVLNMRGSNTATVKDLKASIRQMKTLIVDQTAAVMRQIGQDLGAIKQGISDMQESEGEDDGDAEDEAT